MEHHRVLEQIPEEYYSLRTEYAESNKKEIIKAVNTSRTLNIIVENYKIENSIEAKTLYIKASKSEVNLDFATRHFISFTIKEVDGDHHSIMTFPSVSNISEILIKFLTANQLKSSF